MATTAEQMERALVLKEALLKAYDPEAIILFGSLGRGEGDEFSDVDLLVAIETDRDVKALGEEMTRSLDALVRDKHVIVRTAKEFCRHRDIPGTIVHSAVIEGKVLFEKAGWQNRHKPIDFYAARKREIIEQDYTGSARDFQAQAELSLKKGHLFRFRDFARFSAVRAIKGFFVKHDLHPPRETDLVLLLEKARALEPFLDAYAPFLMQLNDYCPDGAGTLGNKRCTSMLEKLDGFLKEVVDQCFTAQ